MKTTTSANTNTAICKRDRSRLLSLLITTALLVLSCGGPEELARQSGPVGNVLNSSGSSQSTSAAEIIQINGHDCCSLADFSAGNPRTGCSDPVISACVCDALPTCCNDAWGLDCVVQTIVMCDTCDAVDPTVSAILTNDTDGDGISDLDELRDGTDPNDPSLAVDTGNDNDGDGIPNRDDLDIDGDGIPNLLDHDIDGDGIDNAVDADIDGDGLVNAADPQPAGTQCNSGGDCDDGDGCTQQECVNGACFNPSKQDGSSCDNGDDPCNKYVCKAGECTEKTGPKCDDGIDCTIDFCDDGECTAHVPVDEICGGNDECDVKKGCVCGQNPACGNSGSCDPATGNCECGDGPACAQNEVCVNDECMCGASPSCDSRGDCDPASGFCMCGEGGACPVNEVCEDGKCKCGDGPSCAEGYACSEGMCKPQCDPACANGQCVFPDECECDEGWELDADGSCSEPICDPDCANGECVEPNECDCEDGWETDEDGSCTVPVCDPPCENGECVEPNECDCEDGWTGDLCDEEE